jgi:hypothetical protein
MLEKLAAVDPRQALALAQAEGNVKLRDELLQSVLHGWARTSPLDAANWALRLSNSGDQENALRSVFNGAVAASPDEALRVGKLLIQQNPDETLGYGTRLIDALCDAGNFETAAKFAATGDQGVHSSWLAESYSKWAEFQPEQAASAADAITDPAVRNEALHGLIGGWAQADPAALVQFMSQLPAETDKGPLLSQSLAYWVKYDPESASEWINHHEPGPELDQGVAAVASLESVQPEVAIGWVESVVNRQLRSETMVQVLRNWMTIDLPAARHYFETTKNLLPADRQQLGEVFAAMSGQHPGQ